MSDLPELSASERERCLRVLRRVVTIYQLSVALYGTPHFFHDEIEERLSVFEAGLRVKYRRQHGPHEGDLAQSEQV